MIKLIHQFEGAYYDLPRCPDFSREEQIRGLIEQISAYIEHFHHGSVELISAEGDTIRCALAALALIASFPLRLCRDGRRHDSAVFS